MMQQPTTAFTAADSFTLEDIDAAIERAREDRAEAIRAGAESLGLILRHFLSRRCLPLRA
ncbi:MAG TPA: hypothetical protein VGV41_02135 [Pseudolabrys sp.]|jgi:hypothetical protein|uniref:RSP_7527 family protein n=1 Tax=Pseudolabrys sp. TaxID=1960880 RepID=UPI002CAA86BF|nr:hypothetical protein [Pseudolabrys sp.]HEV2627427.1 hypothetical protein [Pseudolabrys sp.]HXD45956.1 hypothetical protein [Pseudolabrys sp.]